MAVNWIGNDSQGFRSEFLQLIRDAGRMTKKNNPWLRKLFRE